VDSLAAQVDAEYRKRFLFYQPHTKQEQLHAFGLTCRERLFLGGNRTGKTFCGSIEGAMHLTGIYPDWWEGIRFEEPLEMWAASDTSETTRDILQAAYLGTPAGRAGTIAPSLVIGDPTSRRGVSGAIDTAYVRHKSGGVSTLGFKSYDQGRAKFQGTRKRFIHLDEEPPLDVYDECFMRTANVDGKGAGLILMTMTPLGGLTALVSNYTADRVAGEPKDGRVFIQAGWEDNPHLSEDERIELEKRFVSRPHELEARKLGIPAIGSGLIYPVARSQIVCDPFPIPDHWKRCAGMDFGWTNPTAVVWLAYDADADIAYVYAEYSASELPPQVHANNIMAKGDWIPIACDPAGQGSGQADGEALVHKYQAHGLNLTPADNSVESGIQEVLERYLNGRLKVFSTCTGVLSELSQYARDEKGRVKKVNDHRMDAKRYAVVTGLQLAVAQNPKRTIRGTISGWAI
jgi:phage terminase large subunit-like protein